MDLPLVKQPLNCWDIPSGQSATKAYRKVMQGSTTIRKEYSQVTGNGGYQV